MRGNPIDRAIGKRLVAIKAITVLSTVLKFALSMVGETIEITLGAVMEALTPNF